MFCYVEMIKKTFESWPSNNMHNNSLLLDFFISRTYAQIVRYESHIQWFGYFAENYASTLKEKKNEIANDNIQNLFKSSLFLYFLRSLPHEVSRMQINCKTLSLSCLPANVVLYIYIYIYIYIASADIKPSVRKALHNFCIIQSTNYDVILPFSMYV